MSPDSPTKNNHPQDRRQRFSELMREHHMGLIVFAGAIVKDQDAAKDIVQEALLTAWNKFDTFDERRDFAKWVRGIIRFKCKDWFRKLQRTPIPDLELVEIEIDITNWQSANAAGTGVFETVENCIEKLPNKLRSAVDTYYIDNHDNRDTADILDISQSNLRKRLERARSLLHECLTRNLTSEPGNSSLQTTTSIKLPH